MIVLWLAGVCLSVCYSSPLYDLSRPQHPLQLSVPTHEKTHPYQFDYAVKDAYRALDFRRNESQDEDGKVTGEYRVLLPDGRTEVVTYTADHYGGFQAIVQYEGEANAAPSHHQSGYPLHQPKYPAPELGHSTPEPTHSDSEPTSPAPEPTHPTPGPNQPSVQPEHPVAQPKYSAPRPHYLAPRPHYLAPRPHYLAPRPHYLAPRPRHPVPGPHHPAYLVPRHRYSSRPEAPPRYGVLSRPRLAYLPPPAHAPVYSSSRPTQAAVSVAAVVAEQSAEEPGTTPGPAPGQPLPLVAIDPVPEVTEVTARELAVTQPETVEEQLQQEVSPEQSAEVAVEESQPEKIEVPQQVGAAGADGVSVAGDVTAVSEQTSPTETAAAQEPEEAAVTEEAEQAAVGEEAQDTAVAEETDQTAAVEEAAAVLEEVSM